MRLANKEVSQIRMAHEDAVKVMADLRAQIPAAEEEVRLLSEATDEHLLGYLAGKREAVAAYEQADARTKAAEAKLERIRRGLKRAEEDAAVKQAQRLAMENKARLDRFFKVFDKKIERAKEITATIEKLKTLFDLALDDDAKAIALWPGSSLPSDGWGLGLGPHAVARMIGNEQWRLCRDETNFSTVVQFPGPISARSELTGQPGKAGVTEQMMLPRLEARLMAARQLAHDVLTG
jgi:hypothetical protein